MNAKNLWEYFCVFESFFKYLIFCYRKPLGEYRSDIYYVEEPTVSKRSLEMYIKYVKCGVHGASEPSPANKEIYRNYVRKLYM